jgi:hypothetical protein
VKALTVHFPYSALILLGLKPVENRGYRTTLRGPLAIHEALKASPADSERAREIVADDGQWAPPGKWHWVLRDPEPMKPVPAKGRLGFWEWNG